MSGKTISGILAIAMGGCVLATPQSALAQFGGFGLPGIGGQQQQSAQPADLEKEIQAIVNELGVIKVVEEKGRRMIAAAELALVDAMAVQGVATAATRNMTALIRDLKAGKTKIEASAGDLTQKVDAIARVHALELKNIRKARDTAVDTATATSTGSDGKQPKTGDTFEGAAGMNLDDGRAEISNVEQRKGEVAEAVKSFNAVYGPMAMSTKEAKAQFIAAVVVPVSTRMGAAQAALTGSLDMIPKVNSRLDAIDREAKSIGPAIIEEGAKMLSQKLPVLIERSLRVVNGATGLVKGAMSNPKDLDGAKRLLQSAENLMSVVKWLTSTIERHNANVAKVNGILGRFSSAMKGSEPLFRQAVGEAAEVLQVTKTIGVKAMTSGS